MVADMTLNNDDLNLKSEAGVLEALNRTGGDELAMYKLFTELFAAGGTTEQFAKDALSVICYFFTDSACEGLAAMAAQAVEQIEGTTFQKIMLENHNGDLAGVQMSNKQKTQFIVFLPDASEPGRFRYSCFDIHGFYSHLTFDTYVDALKGAWIAGFTQPASNVLEDFSTTELWQAGSKRTALIMALNLGQLSYHDYLNGAAA